MECPYCSAELIHEDSYYLGVPGKGKFLGNIYRCPNHEGFEDIEEAQNYLESLPIEERYITPIDELVCWSSIFHVSGSYYTDLSETLHEGYPC